MSNLEDFKKIFSREIKNLTKKIKELSEKYNKLDNDNYYFGLDIRALDKRLLKIEQQNFLNNNQNINSSSKEKIINAKNIIKENNIVNDNDIENIMLDDIMDDDYNNNEEGILFRNQISNRTKIKKNNKMIEEISSRRPNSKDKKIIDNYEHENKKKEMKKRKSQGKSKSKNRSKSKKNILLNDNINNIENENNNINLNYEEKEDPLDGDDNINNIKREIEENKLINNSLIIGNNNYDIVSFGNKDLINNNNNLNNSMLTTTSGKFSEFSFNPKKLGNKLNNNIQPKIENNTFIINPDRNNLVQNESFNNLMNSKIEDIINSEIITNINEIKLILNNLPNFNKFDNLPEFQALFKSSFDGDSAKDFHKFCDGEPNLIILVESTDGKKFGGYTKIGFSSDGEKKMDEMAFLFSFDEKRIYKIKKKFKCICCDPNLGPCFGNKEEKIFQISDNYLKDKSFFNKSNKFYNENNHKKEDDNIVEDFTVNKLEILKLLMI